MGRAGHLPLHRTGRPRRRLLDRHAAAHGVGLAAHRARVQLHPHRHDRPVPPHARAARLLPDGVGRQRPADRTACRELLRRRVRHLGPLRPCARGVRQPAEGPQGLPPGEPTELHRAVRAAAGHRRAGLRGPVPPSRALRRLVAQLHDDQRLHPPDLPTRLPAQPGPRPGVLLGGTVAVGRHVPDRGRAGRARGPRAPRRLPPARLPPHRRRRRHPHRHHPTRAGHQLRGAGRPPRRRALRSAVRLDGHLAGVRRRGAGPGTSPRRARQGHRHRDDLHLRRPDRRHLVARARPADPRGAGA